MKQTNKFDILGLTYYTKGAIIMTEGNEKGLSSRKKNFETFS